MINSEFLDFDLTAKPAFYLIISGFVAWIVWGMLSAVFLPNVEMADGWCVEYVQVSENEEACYRYKNKLEEIKDWHNQQMVGRNAYLMLIVMGLYSLVNLVVFVGVPTWKKMKQDLKGWGLSLFLSAFCAFWPLSLWGVLGLLLPAQEHWLPQIFSDLHDNEVEATLRMLRSMAYD